jgi:hypothetical protein
VAGLHEGPRCVGMGNDQESLGLERISFHFRTTLRPLSLISGWPAFRMNAETATPSRFPDGAMTRSLKGIPGLKNGTTGHCRGTVGFGMTFAQFKGTVSRDFSLLVFFMNHFFENSRRYSQFGPECQCRRHRPGCWCPAMSKSKVNIQLQLKKIFFCILKIWRKESDPELDPDLEPDPLFRGTDPGIPIRIHTKISRIPNTVKRTL